MSLSKGTHTGIHDCDSVSMYPDELLVMRTWPFCVTDRKGGDCEPPSSPCVALLNIFLTLKSNFVLDYHHHDVVGKGEEMKYKLTYSVMDAMLSSPDKPMKKERRQYQLMVINTALYSIERAESPTTEDWKIISQAINMMEMLVEMGFANDEDGLIQDAIESMAKAAQRYKDKNVMRFTGSEMKVIRGIIEDYQTMIENLDERTMIHCHRKTEMRLQDILNGKKRPNDVRITA